MMHPPDKDKTMNKARTTAIRRNPIARALRTSGVCRPQTVAPRKGAGSYRRKGRGAAADSQSS